MTSRERFLDLVDSYLAGELADAGRGELERVLRERPAARMLFWTAVNHGILLRQYSFEQLAPLRLPVAWWRSRTAMAGAAAAALLLVAVGWGALRGFAHNAQPAADAVMASIAAVTSPAGEAGTLRHHDRSMEALRTGASVRSGDHIEVAIGASIDVQLQGESTTFGLGSQTALTIAAGAAGTEVRLHRGSLVADVAHQPPDRHLAITTPQATVQVIGTRLAVTVAQSRTSVDVEQGRVRVAGADATAAVEVSAGESAQVEAGKPPALATVPELQWKDRRPIGLMMLCASASGWPSNPRGWFNDPAIDITTPTGLAAFHHHVDTVIDQTIANLREMDAQALVFWDLEGRETPVGYVGDPRQLRRLAPEMDEVADRIFARVRAAGFAVGMAVRSQAAERSTQGALELRPVADPARLIQAKIDYAQRRWSATIFPVLGNTGNAVAMSSICRRVVAASPGVLLLPASDDAGAYRWSAPWQDPALPTTPVPSEARKAMPGAFGAFASLEADYVRGNHDLLVRAVAAGDILTFRAWYRDPVQQSVKAIYAEAAQQSKPKP